jgi:hypothetical protein
MPQFHAKRGLPVDTPVEWEWADNNWNVLSGLVFDANGPVGTGPETIVISSDLLILPGPGVYLIETEGAAASDTITAIMGLGHGLAHLRLATSGRTVTITNAGTIYLQEGFGDVVLANRHDNLWVRGIGDNNVIEAGRYAIRAP